MGSWLYHSQGLCLRLWPELLSKATQMPGVWATTWGHVGVHVATGVMLIWVACAATQDHGNIRAQAAAEGHVWVHDATPARV